MTQELFRESGGKIPEDSDLKSSFNWDSNYREHMCRNDIQRFLNLQRAFRFLSFFSAFRFRFFTHAIWDRSFDVLKASISMRI